MKPLILLGAAVVGLVSVVLSTALVESTDVEGQLVLQEKGHNGRHSARQRDRAPLTTTAGAALVPDSPPAGATANAITAPPETLIGDVSKFIVNTSATPAAARRFPVASEAATKSPAVAPAASHALADPLPVVGPKIGQVFGERNSTSTELNMFWVEFAVVSPLSALGIFAAILYYIIRSTEIGMEDDYHNYEQQEEDPEGKTSKKGLREPLLLDETEVAVSTGIEGAEEFWVAMSDDEGGGEGPHGDAEDVLSEDEPSDGNVSGDSGDGDIGEGKRKALAEQDRAREAEEDEEEGEGDDDDDDDVVVIGTIDPAPRAPPASLRADAQMSRMSRKPYQKMPTGTRNTVHALKDEFKSQGRWRFSALIVTCLVLFGPSITYTTFSSLKSEFELSVLSNLDANPMNSSTTSTTLNGFLTGGIHAKDEKSTAELKYNSLYAAYAWGNMLFGVLLGAAADRWDGSVLLAASLGITLLGITLMVVAPLIGGSNQAGADTRFAVLLFGRALFGASGIAMMTSANLVSWSWFEDRELGTAFAIGLVIQELGNFLGNAIPVFSSVASIVSKEIVFERGEGGELGTLCAPSEGGNTWTFAANQVRGSLDTDTLRSLCGIALAWCLLVCLMVSALGVIAIGWLHWMFRTAQMPSTGKRPCTSGCLSRDAWRSIPTIVWTIAVYSSLIYSIYLSFGANSTHLFQEVFELSQNSASVLAGMLYVGAVVCCIPCGLWVDFVGKKHWTMVVAAALAVTGCAFFSFLPNGNEKEGTSRATLVVPLVFLALGYTMTSVVGAVSITVATPSHRIGAALGIVAAVGAAIVGTNHLSVGYILAVSRNRTAAPTPSVVDKRKRWSGMMFHLSSLGCVALAAAVGALLLHWLSRERLRAQNKRTKAFLSALSGQTDQVNVKQSNAEEQGKRKER